MVYKKHIVALNFAMALVDYNSKFVGTFLNTNYVILLNFSFVKFYYTKLYIFTVNEKLLKIN